MESKIITATKSKFQDTTKFKRELEQYIDDYLNKGYKIEASNLTSDGMYMYIYVLMVKE